MKKAAILSLLLALPLLGFGQSTEPTPPVTTQGTQITISAKGTDVRGVLHDLFTQAKKNYVLENVSRTELFLSLHAMDFDETLEVVCRLANLTYEIQNDIYYFTKVRPATSTPNLNNPVRNSGPSPAPNAIAARAIGKLSETVLKRAVSGTFNKLDLRTIVKQLGEQAKVTVEIDERVPKYKLDFKLNPTSLGFALKTVADRLDLELVFSDHQTLILQPKGVKPVVEKFDVSTD